MHKVGKAIYLLNTVYSGLRTPSTMYKKNWDSIMINIIAMVTIVCDVYVGLQCSQYIIIIYHGVFKMKIFVYFFQP